MIRKIILENYMSHVRTVIEPAAGLTVLIGPNNCGKSAIAHALEMICYNSDAASFAIRHGTKKATVTIETQDQDGTVHTLVWERKKDTVKYIIDGREISGMGRGKIPDDLHQFLKMPEIDSATGKSFRINFGLQKEPIFLLDEPPSRAAQFFASSSDADRLMDMQRRHKQKEANAKRDKEKLDQEIAKLDQQLGDLSPLEKISQRLGLLEAQHVGIVSTENKIQALSRSIEAIEQSAAAEQLFLMRAHSLTSLRPLPALHLLQPLASKIESISAAYRRATTNQAMLEALTDLKPTPALPATAGIAKLVRDLEIGQRRLDMEADRIRITQPLQAVPKLGDVQALSMALGKLKQLTADLQRQQSKSESLAELVQPPKVEDITSLRQKIGAMVLAFEKCERMEVQHRLLEELQLVPQEGNTKPLVDLVNQIERASAATSGALNAVRGSEKNLAQLQLQIEHWVQANPRCQSCGQSISAELVMTGGHAHE